MKLLFATPKDIDRIRHILRHADLIDADLQPEMLAHFLLLYQDRQLVGLVGLEKPSTAAWLRSLVVLKHFRGNGFGALLLSRIEQYARDLEVRELFLLTQTAQRFFEKHGYQKSNREAVPSFLHQTEQFRDLCPHSAVCMVKRLLPEDRG